MNVLFITLEFARWSDAQYWSYPMGLGVEEGFRTAGVNCFTLPALHGFHSEASRSWMKRARSMFAGTQFDLVWVPLNHLDYDTRFLEWLAGLAPKRVGLALESLQITDAEWRANQKRSRRRHEQVERALPFITHAAVWDEGDVATLTARGIPTKWWCVNVPKRFVRPPRTAPTDSIGLFFGAIYGSRATYLTHPALQGLLVRPAHSLEFNTPYPHQYDELNRRVIRHLASKTLVQELKHIIRHPFNRSARVAATQVGAVADRAALEEYLSELRRLRVACFQLWLDTLAEGLAVVNLPQHGYGYGGRVVESMAAGTPVIAHRIVDRPATQAMYEEGREILLYDSPEELAGHLTRLRADPALGAHLAMNARTKLLELHTMEKRIQQFLSWLGLAE